MPKVEVRNVSLAVEQAGAGPIDLVLVHGFQGDRSGWTSLVDRLNPERCKTTMFDLAGCGESSSVDTWTRCTIDEYAEDLIALCDALDLAKPIVIGHSLGGATALQAALIEPTRFAGLIAVAPASASGLDFVPDEAFPSLSHPTEDEQRELLGAAFRQPVSPDDLERLMAVVRKATPEHIEGAARSMRDFQRLDALCDLSIRSLLICGDRDRHVPLRNHLATQQAIPRCGLQVYFDIGHVPFIETPDRFASDAQRFIDIVQPVRS